MRFIHGAIVLAVLAPVCCQSGILLGQERAAAGKKPDVGLHISLLGGDAVPLPANGFSVRQMNSQWHDGKYYVYADIIAWDNPKHPDSYGSTIGVFSSPDGRKWTYHGDVLKGGEQGKWDYGGVATPGICRFRGKFYLAYSGRQMKDGRGERFLGLAVADEPLGPFRKLPHPIFPLEGYPGAQPCFDDPCLVTRPGGDKMYLYYRYARRPEGDIKAAGDYTVRMRTTTDPEKSWSEDTIILRPGGTAVLETVDAKWIDGQFVLVVLDYSPLAAMYVSTDGVHYQRCRRKNFRDHVPYTRSSPCTNLPGLLVDGEGKCRFINTAGVTDSKGHFTQWIYPVECTSDSAAGSP